MTVKKKGFMFIESFKTFNVRLFHAMLFDMISLLVFFAIAAFYYMYFGRITDAYPLTVNSGTWYIISFILLSAVAIVLQVTNITIFKRLTYKYTVGKTQDMKTWFKFSLMWLIPWFIIFVFIIQAIKDVWRSQLLLIFWLLYLMLTSIARINMTKKPKETILNVFSTFFQWRVLLAYLLMVVVFFAVIAVFSWTFALGSAVFASMLFLGLLLYSAWSRYYLYLTIKD